jgi:hypothetical protein
MIKKRYLIALGAFSAAIGGCAADVKPGAGGNGTGATATGGGSSNPQGTGGSSTKGGSSSGGTGASKGSGGSGNGTATGGSGNGSSTGGSSGSSGSSGTSGSSGSSGSGTTIACQQGIPATTQIPRMLNRQYDAVVRDLLGETTVGTSGQAPSQQLFADFTGSMTDDAWRLYQQVGAAIAHDVISGPNKAMFVNCDTTQAACLTTTVQTFGRKAFRRPMTDTEVSTFVSELQGVMPAGTSDDISEAALYTFLVSPSFLLIPEMSQTAAATAGQFTLSSYEVAARLSFLLWNSVPDDALNQAADANMLQTKAQILAQAQRMVQVQDKAGPMVADFHRVAWAQDNNTATSHWWKMDHDGNALYNSSLKSVYQGEIDRFFEDVTFSGGSFKDLFTSPVAFVTKDIAPIYGLDATQYTTDYTRVTLDATQRPGFMTRMGFLSSYSHASETSPILRGAFITVHMIGLDPGPPLPGATMTPIPPGNYTTMREEITALVNTSSSCQGCHIPYVNPPGFVMENYDSIGKWQTVDPLGGNIDPTADVTFSEGNVVHVTNSAQMMQTIATLPAAQAIYAQLWVAYATGRDPNANDQCLVNDLQTKLSGDGYTIQAMLADVTQADSFSTRVQATP